MRTSQIREGSVKLFIPKAKRIYDAPVFYNPVMTLNRDISVLICKVLKPKSAIDLLAATGVRGLRLKKESGVRDVYINDANPAAVRLIRKNANLNKLSIHISNLRAHEFLATRYKLKHAKFDYVDIDPFGTPVPFLDAGIKAAVENGGIIGVTATDTAALCGSAPAACLRKYGSKPEKTYLMHETGVRILLKKIIETGAQYDLALTPIFCHATQHYVRVYLKSERGAAKADEILKQIGTYQNAGPMWLGKLWDETLVENIYVFAAKDKSITRATKELLYVIDCESKIPAFGFFDLAELRLKQHPKMSDVIAKLQEKGFAAARTHFSPTGIRTNAPITEFLKATKIR